ncbi:MAG: sigma-70 family RNA polymerase sigma factor, partial [Chloroflexaceae bacterium]|nr:sigma-70 family RNA polymerase sigma factor [Chloroflexaceae bacterium]
MRQREVDDNQAELAPEDAATRQQQAEEAAWIAQAIAGDQGAFAQLVERYSSMVYTHAYYRLSSVQDAEDAVQEIFQRAYLRLDTFDTARRFRSWLLTITSNYCTDVQRGWGALKRRLTERVPLEDVDYWLSDTQADPQRSVLQNERY